MDTCCPLRDNKVYTEKSTVKKTSHHMVFDFSQYCFKILTSVPTCSDADYCYDINFTNKSFNHACMSM